MYGGREETRCRPSALGGRSARGNPAHTAGALRICSANAVKNWIADPKVYLLDHLIGAAFSLWRAVFLAETFRTDETIHQGQEAFLAKVISDNSITFGDDKINRAWAVGYYLDDAKLRIERASAYADHHLKTDSRRYVLRNLRLRGTLGVSLTEWEWESAHFALRYMLRILDPQAKVQPVQPNSPRPEGLEAVMLGDESQ
jgi:hypothetical protein